MLYKGTSIQQNAYMQTVSYWLCKDSCSYSNMDQNDIIEHITKKVVDEDYGESDSDLSESVSESAPFSDGEIIVSDSSVVTETPTPGSSTPGISVNLTKNNQTPGLPSNQLVGHTPTHQKASTSKHIGYHHKDDFPPPGEITLDLVHKSLTKMIGSVLERLEKLKKG